MRLWKRGPAERRIAVRAEKVEGKSTGGGGHLIVAADLIHPLKITGRDDPKVLIKRWSHLILGSNGQSLLKSRWKTLR